MGDAIILPFPRAAAGPSFTVDVVDADHDPHALGPTLRLHLAITETTGTRVHALALRTRIRVEPAARRYRPEQQDRLVELFGDPSRWGRTLQPMQMATVSSLTPAFAGGHTLVLEVPMTFDTELAVTRYFRGVDGPEPDEVVPLRLLFSGTVFYAGPHDEVQIGLVPWSLETTHRLPVAVWRDMARAFHGGTTWLALPERTLAALSAWRAARALPSWEATFTALLEAADE